VVEGVWLVGERYRIFEPGTDHEVVVHIPGADTIYDMDELDEICHWQREQAEKEWLGKEPQKPLSKDQQHDLGKVLFEIRDSQTFWKNSLHGRYW
jgi:hypothetical protein